MAWVRDALGRQVVSERRVSQPRPCIVVTSSELTLGSPRESHQEPAHPLFHWPFEAR